MKPPILALFLALFAWREIVTFERRHPSATLAAFWAACPRGMWLLWLLLVARTYCPSAEHLAEAHIRGAAAFRRTVDARGLRIIHNSVGADAVRVAVGPLDWSAIERTLAVQALPEPACATDRRAA